MKKMLITGASGFIGSHLVDRALTEGWEVWAGVRSNSSREWLQDSRIHCIELDYVHEKRLLAQLEQLHDTLGKWEVIINNMGITKTSRQDDFMQINCQAVIRFIQALREKDMMPQHFVQMSSLSAWGPIHEQDALPIALSDRQQPNTDYGKSKAKAAEYLKSQHDIPYLIFYPTGVYGPREKDYYMMFKTVQHHLDFVAGFSRQDLTFVYVEDLTECIFLAIRKRMQQREFIVAEERSYTSTEFRQMIQSEFGHQYCLALRVPLFLLRLVCWLSGKLTRFTGKTPTLNQDKYHIMAQRNWKADVSALKNELDYVPRTTLAEGVHKTFEWYRSHGWI